MKAAKLGFPRLCRGVAAAALVALGCAGCASRAAVTDPALSDGAVDTGTFPNLNVPPPVATETFNPGSLQAHRQAISVAQAGQAQDGQNAAALAAQGRAEQARLRSLAAAQQAETLKAVKAPARAPGGAGRGPPREAAASAASKAEQERARRLAETSRAAAKKPEAAPDQKARDAAIQGARKKQAEIVQGVTSTEALSPAERERLRKLAAARQAETLKAIEKAD